MRTAPVNSITDLGKGSTTEQVRAVFLVQPDSGSKLAAALARIEAKLDALASKERKSSPSPQPAEAQAEFVSVKQAAAITQLSQGHLRRAIWSRELPAANAGTPRHPIWRIGRKDLADWLRSKMGGSRVPPRSVLGGLVDRYFNDV